MSFLEKLDTVGIWGITVTVGYLLTAAAGYMGMTGSTVNYGLITAWLALMLVPAYYSVQKYREDGNWKNLNFIWAVIMVLGVLANYAGQATATGQILQYSYYQKWFVLPGALFAYTAYRMDGFSRNIYAVATVLNLAVAFGLSTVPVLQTHAFTIAAVIQGLPMLADWYKFNM